MSSVTIQLLHIFFAVGLAAALWTTLVTMSSWHIEAKLGLFCITLLVCIPLGFYKMPNSNIIEKRAIYNVRVYYEQVPSSYEEPFQMDFTYKDERVGIFMKGTRISVGEYNDIEYKVRQGQSNEIQFIHTGISNKLLKIKPETEAIIIYDPSTVNKTIINGGR